jgi:hypothetical protein
VTDGSAAAAEATLGWFDAIVLGLVEGVTEFLPISSTGHLIVAQRLLGLPDSPVHNLFAIGVQTGAITAILALYRQRLLAAARTLLRPAADGPNLLWQIGLAAAPAALLGLAADDWIDGHLFSTRVVALTMVLGGIVLLWLDRLLGKRTAPGIALPAMPYRLALAVGMFQCPVARAVAARGSRVLVPRRPADPLRRRDPQARQGRRPAGRRLARSVRARDHGGVRERVAGGATVRALARTAHLRAVRVVSDRGGAAARLGLLAAVDRVTVARPIRAGGSRAGAAPAAPRSNSGTGGRSAS